MTPVLVRVSIALIKHYDQKQHMKEGFVLLTFPHHCSSSKKVRSGTWGQELMPRPWRSAAYSFAPQGVLNSGVASPTVGCTHIIKKVLTGLPIAQSREGSCSVEVPSFR